MLYLRRAIWPLREVLASLQRDEYSLIEETTQKYLRDVLNHVIQVVDTMEIYREMISGMMNIYLSSVSNKMNAIMKVLTLIATIFIPLTFIAGVYGMNFKFMPELAWKPGYFVCLGIMAAIGITMLVWFSRKKWL